MGDKGEQVVFVDRDYVSGLPRDLSRNELLVYLVCHDLIAVARRGPLEGALAMQGHPVTDEQIASVCRFKRARDCKQALRGLRERKLIVPGKGAAKGFEILKEFQREQARCARAKIRRGKVGDNSAARVDKQGASCGKVADGNAGHGGNDARTSGDVETGKSNVDQSGRDDSASESEHLGDDVPTDSPVNVNVITTTKEPTDSASSCSPSPASYPTSPSRHNGGTDSPPNAVQATRARWFGDRRGEVESIANSLRDGRLVASPEAIESILARLTANDPDGNGSFGCHVDDAGEGEHDDAESVVLAVYSEIVRVTGDNHSARFYMPLLRRVLALPDGVDGARAIFAEFWRRQTSGVPGDKVNKPAAWFNSQFQRLRDRVLAA